MPSRSRTPSSRPPSEPPVRMAGQSEGDYTGKHLVLLRDDGVKEGLQAIKDVTGLKDVCNTTDYSGAAVEMADADQSEVFVLDKLKVAVVSADPTQLGSLKAAAAEDGAILAVEPERIMYALAEPLWPQFPFEYVRGYVDGYDHGLRVHSGVLHHLYDQIAGGVADAVMTESATPLADNTQFTWGLQATLVSQSRFSGRGIRVAVLDTGMDLDHPDFAGRIVPAQTESFIRGETAQDTTSGHGTHCIGTSLGFQQLAGGTRRYGCAYLADIFVGKVLDNSGSGGDRGILAGINWAITEKCHVISMSLGARVQPGEPYSTIYENVAQRALRSNPGTLIVAAAGNESNRPGLIAPVGRPANCPSILAVGALDANMRIASFSNGGMNLSGGGVDIAGPGVSVFSSVPDPFPPSVQPPATPYNGRPWPPMHHSISGTSMACPHVAGIAALWLEARGAGTTAEALWQLLTGNARRLTLPSRDVGAGLVQAPI